MSWAQAHLDLPPKLGNQRHSPRAPSPCPRPLAPLRKKRGVFALGGGLGIAPTFSEGRLTQDSVSKISDAKPLFSHSVTYGIAAGRHLAFSGSLVSVKKEGTTVSFHCTYLSSCVKGTPWGACPCDFPYIVNRRDIEGARERPPTPAFGWADSHQHW